MIRKLNNEKIVIATHNKGKLEEFAELFKPHGVTTFSAGGLGLTEPEETEDNFRGNARIKALFAMKHSGHIAISDDSGLCVDALNGDPGVYTADWAGPTRDWNQAMRLVEEKLQAAGAATPDKRKGQFKCTLCVMWPDGEERYYEGVSHGQLIWPPRGALGHGYDPVFVPDGQPQSLAEMTHAKKNSLSHRGLALEKLLSDLF